MVKRAERRKRRVKKRGIGVEADGEDRQSRSIAESEKGKKRRRKIGRELRAIFPF
jgi:hypothetical protein